MNDQITASSHPAVVGDKSGLAQELLKRHMATMKPEKVKVKMTLKPGRSNHATNPNPLMGGGAANQWMGE